MTGYHDAMWVEELPIFVYGTLRSGERNAGALAGKTLCRVPARAPRHQLWLREYPYIADGAGAVAGELVTILPAIYQQVLAELDELEMLTDRAAGTGPLYCRVRRSVVAEGSEQPAWLYHTAPEVLEDLRRRPELLIPSGDWTDVPKPQRRVIE